MHLADFNDADMFVRPVPAANHAAYQLAHLLRTTIDMTRAIAPTVTITLPPKTQGDAKGSPTSDDPNQFPSKAELLDAYEALVDATIEGVRVMSDADLGKPSPQDFQAFAPTLGQLALMVPMHMSMHVGQIQVIRRKLGKPRLF
jgi:hypothetical protein